jgi:hypothetical protein
MELIKKHMDRMYYHITKLLAVLIRIKDEKDMTNKFVMNELYTNPILTHFDISYCFFMDIYTIGRMLKPGYNYCMFYGGCFHSTGMLKLLEEMYKLKPVKEIPMYNNKCPPFSHDVFDIDINIDDETDIIKKGQLAGLSRKWINDLYTKK